MYIGKMSEIIIRDSEISVIGRVQLENNKLMFYHLTPGAVFVKPLSINCYSMYCNSN